MTATMEAPTEKYVMPMPRKSEFVYWYERANKNRPPAICMVEQIHADNVFLKRMDSGAAGGGVNNWALKDSVRHVSDPRLTANPEWAKAGGWDFTEEGYLLRELERKVEILMRSSAAHRPVGKKD